MGIRSKAEGMRYSFFWAIEQLVFPPGPAITKENGAMQTFFLPFCPLSLLQDDR